MLICSDQTVYTGITTNLEKRVLAHNTKKTGAMYTKARRPVRLVYAETAENKSAALKREYALKQLTRKQKIDFLASQS